LRPTVLLSTAVVLSHHLIDRAAHGQTMVACVGMECVTERTLSKQVRSSSLRMKRKLRRKKEISRTMTANTSAAATGPRKSYMSKTCLGISAGGCGSDYAAPTEADRIAGGGGEVGGSARGERSPECGLEMGEWAL
jgi:hypothetical protein